jgi:hypothetical protein
VLCGEGGRGGGGRQVILNFDGGAMRCAQDMESVDAKRSRLLCLHEDCIDQMPLTRSTRYLVLIVSFLEFKKT